MARVRISSTVGSRQWDTARRLLPTPSCQILDRALAALIDRLETDHERAVLSASPYDDDADLVWHASTSRGLPYDGPVPPDVVRLAEQRQA